MSSPTAFFGSFDAERTWDDARSVHLPQSPSPYPDDAVSAMDEVLAGMCGDGDVLLTRATLLDEHREHLQSVGLPSFTPVAANAEELASTLRRLAETHVLAPWAVTGEVELLWKESGVSQPLPASTAAQRVNSKEWSTRIRNELALPGFAALAHSAPEVESIGREIFARNAHGIVIKEPFGVSGRGSMHVPTESRLRRFVARLHNEEANGHAVRLILEEFLDKTLDFSTHLTISPNGAISFDGVHGLENRHLSYGMSYPLPENWQARLRDDRRYVEAIMTTAGQAFDEGYFGPLCVDGMLLRSGEVLPIVEINARGSLGAINARLDAHFERRGLHSALTAIPVLSKAAIAFAGVVDRMRAERLSPDRSRPTGVIALTARTLPFHGGDSDAGGGPRTGRMFVSVVHAGPSEVPAWIDRMRSVLASVGYVMT